MTDLKFALRKRLHQVGLLHKVRSMTTRHGRPLFNPADPRTQMSTKTCLDWLISRNLLAGTDFMEFGIFRGFNVWFVQAYCRLHHLPDMRYFGFDSFFGLPEITGVDRSGTFKEGEFSAYREDVEYYLERYGVDWSQTFLVEGFFSKTLIDETVHQHRLRRCAFAVIDCDLYSSTVEVLNFLKPLLARTAVLYFDDWDDFRSDEKGEALAFREFQQQTATQLRTEEIPLEPRITKGRVFAVHKL
jgi:O-methyltransferase